MRQMEVCRKRAKLGGDEELTVVYSVTVDELIGSPADTVLETYGVDVTICETGECAAVRNVTFSKSKILSLVDLMASCLVTPVTARDVVEDWLCVDPAT